MIEKTYSKSTVTKRKLAKRIERTYFVRFHMFIILLATVLSGVVCSKLLIFVGVSNMPVRYGIAIILSYLLFFLFVKLWLLYIGIGRSEESQDDKSRGSSDWTDVLPSGLTPSFGGDDSFADFGGGSSGGGGASASFAEASPSTGASIGVGSSSGAPDDASDSSTLEDVLDLDADVDIKLVAIILLGAMVLAVLIAGVYLLWFAPTILSDAAFEAVLVASLAGKLRQAKAKGWESAIFRSTWWVFLSVLVVSVAFGIVAQKAVPTAVTVRDLLTALR